MTLPLLRSRFIRLGDCLFKIVMKYLLYRAIRISRDNWVRLIWSFQRNRCSLLSLVWIQSSARMNEGASVFLPVTFSTYVAFSSGDKWGLMLNKYWKSDATENHLLPPFPWQHDRHSVKEHPPLLSTQQQFCHHKQIQLKSPFNWWEKTPVVRISKQNEKNQKE